MEWSQLLEISTTSIIIVLLAGYLVWAEILYKRRKENPIREKLARDHLVDNVKVVRQAVEAYRRNMHHYPAKINLALARELGFYIASRNPYWGRETLVCDGFDPRVATRRPKRGEIRYFLTEIPTPDPTFRLITAVIEGYGRKGEVVIRLSCDPIEVEV